MKRPIFSTVIRPLYVTLTSLLGLVVVIILFVWGFPLSLDHFGRELVSTNSFVTFLFIALIQTMFYSAIFFLVWKQFIDLAKEHTEGKALRRHLSVVIMLFVAAILYYIFSKSVTNFPFLLLRLNLPALPSVSEFYSRYRFLVFIRDFSVIPIILCISLINILITNVNRKIQYNQDHKEILFNIAQELLRYRRILQTSLWVMAIIVSIVPVESAALRQIFLEMRLYTSAYYPFIIIVIYGLLYTIPLISFYVPTYLILTETSRKLLDEMCPVSDLPSLEDTLRKRKALSEWLQTDVNVVQNISTVAAILFPLITSSLSIFLPAQ